MGLLMLRSCLSSWLVAGSTQGDEQLSRLALWAVVAFFGRAAAGPWPLLLLALSLGWSWPQCLSAHKRAARPCSPSELGLFSPWLFLVHGSGPPALLSHTKQLYCVSLVTEATKPSPEQQFPKPG